MNKHFDTSFVVVYFLNVCVIFNLRRDNETNTIYAKEIWVLKSLKSIPPLHMMFAEQFLGSLFVEKLRRH